jgi:hypothetical protein
MRAVLSGITNVKMANDIDVAGRVKDEWLKCLSINQHEWVLGMRRRTIRELWGVPLLIGISVLLMACNEEDSDTISAVPTVPVLTSPSRIAITIDDLSYVTYGGARPQGGLRYTQTSP